MRYETQFCAEIPCRNSYESEWAFINISERASNVGARQNNRGGGHNILVWSDKAGEPEVVVEIVAEMQRKFGILAPFVLPFADTCSERIPGEIGGGAFFAYRGVVFDANPQLLLDAFMEDVDALKGSRMIPMDIDMTFGGRAICTPCLDGTCKEA